MTTDQEKALRAELEEVKRWRAVAAHIAATDIASLRTALAAAQGALRDVSEELTECGYSDKQARKAAIAVLDKHDAALTTSGKPGGEVVLGERRPLEPEEVVPAYSAAESGKPGEAGERDVLKAQIEHMVNRFLAWKLPTDFAPDAGISFKATFNEHTPFPARHEPVGTNLFTATQAEATVRHMVEGMPAGESGKPGGKAQAEDALRVALEGVIGYAASRADELREYTVIAYRHAEAAVDRARAALRLARRAAPAPPEGRPAPYVAPPETHPETCPMPGMHTRTSCNWFRGELAKYGRHIEGCTIGNAECCSCGLLQALAAKAMASTAIGVPR